MKKNINISILIPVFNTEPLLKNCFDSIKQSFLLSELNVQVVIINDASTKTDANNNKCKKIVKVFKKEAKQLERQNKRCFLIDYAEHYTNKGLLETRRDALFLAQSDYVLIVDSDDTITPNCLTDLYNEAINTGCDVIHGKTNIIANDLNSNAAVIKGKRANLVHQGAIKENLLNSFLIKKDFNGFVWGKLYKKEIVLRVFDHIPPMYCTVQEDFITSLWIFYTAKSYYGIDSTVYNYNIETGISSKNQVTDISQIEKICSAAGVFTAIYSEIESLPQDSFTSEQIQKIRIVSANCLINNINQLKASVTPELQQTAYDILCDYWGQDFVDKFYKEF